MKFRFNTDAEIVKSVYNNSDNYIIQYDDTYADQKTCAVYFSSNGLYFPSTEDVFRTQIIERNAFEFYGTRIKVWKHILVRDIFKEWYIDGINSQINSFDKLILWIKSQTEGLDTYMVGISSGAFAAIIIGSLTNAKRVLAFNPQFELRTFETYLTQEALDHKIQPKDCPCKSGYWSAAPYITPSTNIYYFYSNRSQVDIKQNEEIKGIDCIHRIEFKASHHGIPFLKVALAKVINMSDSELDKLTTRQHNPILFSIKVAGLFKSIRGAYKQVYKKYFGKTRTGNFLSEK